GGIRAGGPRPRRRRAAWTGCESGTTCRSHWARAGRRSLAGVSFDVARGASYGLLGPNGSGKSTLIRILSTLLFADGGEVRLLGYRLPDDQAQVRRLIGRVSVDAAFYKKLSARENLLYTALLYGLKPSVAERQALQALEQLGMEDHTLSIPLEEMSRGMQQK